MPWAGVASCAVLLAPPSTGVALQNGLDSPWNGRNTPSPQPEHAVLSIVEIRHRRSMNLLKPQIMLDKIVSHAQVRDWWLGALPQTLDPPPHGRPTVLVSALSSEAVVHTQTRTHARTLTQAPSGPLCQGISSAEGMGL